MQDLVIIEQKIGYKFKNKSLLELAFTHCSEGELNNEKLEFLGDSVLGFLVANYLYESGQTEGQMTKKKADIVCEQNLAEAMDRLNIMQYLRASAHLKQNLSPAVKCDLCEAIIGAIYLDSGLNPVKEFIKKFINLDKIIVDYKSALQEFVQVNGENNLHYESEQVGGESHNPVFETKLYLKDKLLSSATGTSKRESEQTSARLALALLKGTDNYGI